MYSLLDEGAAGGKDLFRLLPVPSDDSVKLSANDAIKSIPTLFSGASPVADQPGKCSAILNCSPRSLILQTMVDASKWLISINPPAL